MIVDDFDLVALPFVPHEADAPLVVDSDAVLACALPPQGLQTIRGRSAQVVEALRGVEHPQLPAGDCLNLIWKAARYIAVPDALGFFIREASDHAAS
jgi:hypothetical protein